MASTGLEITAACAGCGHSNRDGARFCAGCGAPLANAVECPACSAPTVPDQRFCDSCGHTLAAGLAHAPSPEPARAVAGSLGRGRYELGRFLGEGGRKRVYLARDTRLDREVAVALIKTDGLDEGGITRAQREAEAMGRLGDHPHIVTVHDIGEESGQLYIVSQYMAGGDLDDLLQRSEDHRLPVREVVRLADEIARALEHAHAHGVVHRDLKPKNVWLTSDGTAKLGDFGLAVALDRSRITLDGMMVGTVAYMSPEQGLGRPVDARSDLYSLGALLYELVCGRQPFVGDDAVAVISQHINTAPVAPSWHNAEVPQPLEDLILRLLAKAPDDRPQTAAAVRETIAALSSGEFAAAPAADDGGNPLDRLTTSVFVGRERETKELRSSLEAVLSGRGRLVTVAGEMGIGKTRICSELGTYAGLRGAQVLWGRCYEGEGAPAYWPWVQVIRSYVHERDAGAISEDMGSGAADIAQIVSEVRDRLPDLPAPPELEPDQARFRLFDSVATFLRNAAGHKPVVVILDDLHWADTPSLLLLQFLAAELQGSRVLILGAYRDSDLGMHHPLSDVLAGLRRERAYKRVLLRGLAFDDVRAMLEAVAEHELAPHDLMAVEALHRETEGNPFFIEEIVRHLVEEGRLYREDGQWVTNAQTIEELGIPEGVRETISRRLAKLSETCSEMLATAAVAGREFSTEVVRRALDLPADALLEALDEAETARVVARAPGGQGRLRFAHGLTRETLYGELSTARRVRLHQRIAEAIESIHAGDLDPHVGELAYHWGEAIQAGEASKVIGYARRAAERATRTLAYEAAIANYERALQALELEGSVDEDERCELLLALGDAQWRAGARDAARRTFQRASGLARQTGSPDHLARAALGFGAGLGWFGWVERANETLIGLLEEALAELPEDDGVLRARALARLAVELYYTPAVERRSELSAAAVEMARRIGDPRAEMVALYSRQWSVFGPASLDERRAAAEEILDLAEQLGDREMAFRARHLRYRTLLELGDLAGVDREVARMSRLADELREPFYQWLAKMFEAMRLMLHGRFDEFRSRADEALALGQRGSAETANVLYGDQIAVSRVATGGLDELVPGMEIVVDQYPWLPVWRAALAVFHAELGSLDQARRHLDELAADGFAGVSRDGNWLLSMSLLALACGATGDAERAAVLHELLLPYADRCVADAQGASCAGSVRMYLGVLCATLGDPDQAEEHLHAAIAANAELGERPFVLVYARIEYASVLAARGKPGDREAALDQLGLALEMAEQAGMAHLVSKALAGRLALQGLEDADTETSLDAVATSIEEERPDLARHAAPDGTVTIVFSDIESSTFLNECLGDTRWFELLQAHNEVVREQVRLHGGYEVKSQGDGFMLAFASAGRALACAVGIQRALADSRERRPADPVHVRIGLHTGEAIRSEEDFFGRSVAFAARVAAQARGDEILVSSLLKELVEGGGEFDFGEPREVQLKGLRGDQLVFPVEWEAG